MGSPDCNPPRGFSHPGVFLSHAASPLNRQPEDESDSITFDGRIDNREDLILRFRGHLRDRTSDAILALTAWEQLGAVGLADLVGEWSLAIWDAERQTIVLASDFAGTRPLYYCVQGGRAFWSTRLKPLVNWAEANEIDDEFVAGLLAAGGSPHRTPYRGIFSVPPAHVVSISRDAVEARPFWKLPFADSIRYRRESEYEEHLRALFMDAVRSRLCTDAPVIAELSGGLDSSSVVCMAHHLIRRGQAEVPRLATLSYEHEGSLDTRFYTAVEQHCGFESIHVSTAAEPFLTETRTGGTVPGFWECLHTRTAAAARRIGARTCITGKLGDLVMGQWTDDSSQVAGLLRRGEIGPAFRQALAWSKVLRIPISWVLWRALRLCLPAACVPASRCPVTDNPLAPAKFEDSVAPDFRKRLELSREHRFFSKDWMQAPPERRRHFRGLMESLELRKMQPPEALEHLYYTHPFLHRPLLTFMLSIPAEAVCGPGEPRRLMRRAFRELWPPELRKRRSKDMFGGVFLDSLRPLANRFLKAPQRLQVVERGYVDPQNLTKRLELLSHSLECNEPQLRHIILLETWLQARVSGAAPATLSA
jgi:asparagine synthase (glutamine-hydrolysing)